MVKHWIVISCEPIQYTMLTPLIGFVAMHGSRVKNIEREVDAIFRIREYSSKMK